MGKNETFEQYRRQLVKEGVIKSVFFGIIFGGTVLSFVAFFTWLFGYKPGLFFALASFVVVAGVTIPLFYFGRYKPTVKQIAKRVDALGLEERVLTMTELQDDDSFIAQAQREDTSRVLGRTDSSKFKMIFSTAAIVFVVIAAVFTTGMTTVSALHFAGIIPSGITTIEYIRPKGVFTVAYSVEEGGQGTIIYYTGDWSAETPVDAEGEKVKEGESARAVYAVAEDYWSFVCWSDGNRDPYRHDVDVNKDIIVTVLF